MQRLNIEEDSDPKKNRWTLFLCSIITVIVVLVAFIFFWRAHKINALVPADIEVPLLPSRSTLHVFKKAAVCSDGPPCSEIGRDILKKNGSAMDAALASMFCNGVVNNQAMGLGGGFLMTYYERKTQTAFTLNAREAAPSKAHKDMFANKTDASKTGGLAVGVPGELAGYWEAWRKFGRLPWREIIEPSVKLCREGYNMTRPQHDVLDFRPDIIKTDPNFKKMFFKPDTNERKRFGDVVIPERLCDTLEIISKEGGTALYEGPLSKIFIEDIQDRGGIITEDDLRNYRAEWSDPIKVVLKNGVQVYSMPPPGSGALLTHILKVLDGYNFTAESFNNTQDTILSMHRIIEAFKFGYARRTELADPDFIDVTEVLKKLTSTEYAEETRLKINDTMTYSNPDHYGAVFYQVDDHGTAHISVLSEEGDAVSVTSSVNLYFGAGFTSLRTGIVLNSVMDDFSTPGLVNYFGLPPSPNNFIAPGKRPLSSSAPSILVDTNGDVVLVIGAAGGTKITTSVVWVITRFLWLGENIKQAIDASRIHHQLMPMKVSYEFGLLSKYVKGLKKLGHEMYRYKMRGSIVCGISKSEHHILANADHRKEGDVFGYD